LQVTFQSKKVPLCFDKSLAIMCSLIGCGVMFWCFDVMQHFMNNWTT
jgi:hypothetical protein